MMQFAINPDKTYFNRFVRSLTVVFNDLRGNQFSSKFYGYNIIKYKEEKMHIKKENSYYVLVY